MAYTYDYPKASVTVDCVIFDFERSSVLLIQRKFEPFKDQWAFPGGFIEMHETLKESAYRELEEETGVTELKLMQLCTVGNPERDPRGRTVSVVYWGCIDRKTTIQAGDDAKNVSWFNLDELPKMAFDHLEIIQFAQNTLLYQ